MPCVRERVILIVAELEGAGFDPLVFETFRDQVRVAELVKRGTGSWRTFHRFRVAVDIISREHEWTPPRAFWVALEQAAERHGFTHGAGRTRVDLPHVQAVPHDWYRALNRQTPAQRERTVAGFLDDFDRKHGVVQT